GDGHPVGPRHGCLQLSGTLPNFAQVAALDVLEHDVRLSRLVRRRFQYLGHARVLELRLNAGFIKKSREKGAVSGMLSPHELHDAGAFRALDATRAPEVDLSHTAASQGLEQGPAAQGVPFKGWFRLFGGRGPRHLLRVRWIFGLIRGRHGSSVV